MGPRGSNPLGSGPLATLPPAAGGAFTLAIDTGSYTITGNDVGLLRGERLTADTGSYALTGNDVNLRRGLKVTIDPGSYALTGNDVALTYTPVSGEFTIPIETGDYALTGNDVTLLRGEIVTADQGSYALGGNDVTLTYTPVSEPAGMAAIVLRERWKRQPPAGVGLDRGHQLLKGITEGWCGNSPGRTLVRAYNTVAEGSNQSIGPGNGGLGVQWSTSASGQRLKIAEAADDVLPTEKCTIAIYREVLDTTMRPSILFGAAGPTAAERVLVSAPWEDGNAQWDWDGYVEAAGERTVGPGYTKVARTEALVFTAGPAGGKIWRDGILIGDNSIPSPSRASIDGGFYLGDSGGPSPVANDIERIYLALIIDAQWTQAQVRQWSENPYQVFEPVRRRVFFPGAGLSVTFDPGSYAVTGNDVALIYTPVSTYTLTLEPGAYTLTGNDLTFRRTLRLGIDTGQYVITGNDVGLIFSGEVVPPPVTGAGGRARVYRYLRPREYEPETRTVRVLIEEEKPSGGVEYKEVEWQSDASWQALMAAIEAITVELGNFDGTLARSKLLRDELTRLKKKRNQRIILLAIE